nr:YgbK domain protein [Salmonella sp. NCTC 7297]
MISATASTQALAAIQQQYGAAEASLAVEALFSLLAARLAEGGITRFIVAGGENFGCGDAKPRYYWFSHRTVHFTRCAVGQRAPCASLAGAKVR